MLIVSDKFKFCKYHLYADLKLLLNSTTKKIRAFSPEQTKISIVSVNTPDGVSIQSVKLEALGNLVDKSLNFKHQLTISHTVLFVQPKILFFHVNKKCLFAGSLLTQTDFADIIYRFVSPSTFFQNLTFCIT